MAHFCLVGAGDDAGAGPIGQRNNTAASDLSGEAMGLRTASASKVDSPGGGGGATGDTGGPKADRGGDAGGSTKPDGGGFGRDSRDRDGKDKDGGFFGGFSRALSRGYGHAVGREGEEEEIGREEDVQVARFVLMLLQYNFPYITHVRGDMAACLEELSAQVRRPGGPRESHSVGVRRAAWFWGGVRELHCTDEGVEIQYQHGHLLVRRSVEVTILPASHTQRVLESRFIISVLERINYCSGNISPSIEVFL